MRRVVLWMLGCLLVLGFQATAQAAEPAKISRNEATSSFGENVVFELEAESSSPIREVTFLYALGVQPGDVPAYTEAEAKWQPGTAIEASFTRDTSIEFLPVGVTVRYKWQLVAEDGTITETPEQSVQYQDTRFNWQEKSSRGITVRWYDGDQAWGQALLDSALGGLDRLEQRIGGSVEDPMTISIYSNTRDMRGALPPNSADWIGGQARPDLGLIIGSIDAGDDAELGRLVPHELSHLVLHQATNNNYGGMPVWFDEGLAVANQDSPDAGFSQMVERAAKNGELIPLRALASNFPSDPEKALLSYAQSESVVRYIEATYGIESITKLVAQFKSGVTDDVAVQTVLNRSLDTLDSEWRSTLPEAQGSGPAQTLPDDTAPADRFSEQPRSSAPSNPGLPNNPAATESVPLWIWLAGIGGLLLIVFGTIWIIRSSRQPRY